MGKPAAFINSDVALGSEPVIGSFTVDDLTYAVTDEASVELVGVSPGWQQVTGSQEGEDSGVAPMLASGSDGPADLALPESVTYENATYALTSIGAYAFYLSGVTSVTLPQSVADVDDRAFRSSDVANVTVADDNPAYSSFDGALYSADQSSLLLIPGGRQGAVRIPSQAADVPPSVFSHCALVDAISVDAGGAHLSSWEGLLYDADGTTLLRVPAGATDITIREGCTTIAAGALEACASLERINAPTSVTSISPDVFTAIPTVSLPAASLVEESPQLSAMVALSATDDDLPKVDPATVEVGLGQEVDAGIWERSGFSAVVFDSEDVAEPPVASLQSFATQRATGISFRANSGGTFADPNTGAAVSSVWIGAGTVEPRRTGVYSAWYGKEIRLTPKTGCTFAHWSAISASGNGHNAWGSLNAETESVNNNFWAIWSFSNTWNPNGGYWGLDKTNTASLKTDSYSGKQETGYVGSIPNRDGYAFNGWSVSSNATSGLTTVGAYEPTIYFATWAKKASYSITLNKNSGTGGTSTTYYWPDKGYTTSSTSTTVVKVGSTLVSSLPTRTGYTFAGYYSAASGGTQYIDANGKLTSNAPALSAGGTWYAHWTKKASFAVTLNKGSGTGGTSTVYYWTDKGYTTSSTSTTVIASGSVLVSSLPTWTGYTFSGYWSASSGGTQYVDASGKLSTNVPAITAATTWYARWVKKTSHAITLNKNNGTGGTSTVYYWTDKGYTTSSTSTTVIASGSVLVSSLPTRTGYAFAGYYSAASGGTQYVDSSGKRTTSAPALTAAATWYAHWNANSYTVEYWNKAGTTKLSTDTGFKYDTARNLAAKPTTGVNAGYTAVGWAASANQSAKAYDFGSSQKNLATSGTKKLYLAETANTITLTWNSQGGSAVANTSATYSPTAKVPMPASNPTKAGYTFAGWWTAATGGTQVTSSTALPTANATYHAHWSLNPYAITYDLAGGSVSGNPTTYNTETATFTLKNPVRTGYAFAGWSGTGLSGSANKTVTIAKGSTGDRAYTANWTRNAVHLITLDAQGGQGGTEGFYQWTGKGFYASGSPTDATEPMASITAPTRAGYAYAGYWSGAGGTGTQRIANTSLAALPNTTFSGPATLYAKWEKVASLRVDLKAPEATSPGTTPVYYWPGCGYTLSPYSTDVIAPGGSLALTLPRRQGYIFSGYYDAPAGGTQMIDAKGALTSHAPALSSAAAWHAQWAPAVSADVPLEVEARVDVLGMEEQAPGSGYIESRCGEPLKVAEVKLTPLDGAKELFGASNVADVFLEVLANDGASPSARFSMGASATEADPARLAPFAMQAYQDRVPVSYRFDVPEALLSTLAEATKPVCSVVYTVALA